MRSTTRNLPAPTPRLYSRYSQHSFSCAMLSHYLVGHTQLTDSRVNLFFAALVTWNLVVRIINSPALKSLT